MSIKLDIQQLTQKETALLKKMMRNGYFEERDAFNEKFDIYAEWAEIFNGYGNLALADDMEALKRAVFFIWYNIVEPVELSGIKYIDKNLAAKVLTMLNTMIEEDKIDCEFKWMLSYYYSLFDYYLLGYTGIDSLINFSQQNDYLWKGKKEMSLFENRGQLGNYWKSLNWSI
ncbi:MAG: hypothetical protein HYX61_00085 [Gammaproteobacteria bacterium]|jgi:hypothetical protein|nr:hypothetical protein [Gammaproteobacteria bacterium]